jgi:hypothetical protein
MGRKKKSGRFIIFTKEVIIMDKHSFDTINQFCDDNKETMTQVHRDFMIRKFAESYYSAIEERRKTNPNLTQVDKDNIRDVLLNKNNLENILVASQNNYNTIKDQYYVDFKKRIDKGSFLKSILASVIASVIYSVSLIFIFWIAKDQIASWLISLTKSN